MTRACDKGPEESHPGGERGIVTAVAQAGWRQLPATQAVLAQETLPCCGGSRVCFLRPSSESIKCKALHNMGWMVPPALFSLSSKICLKIRLCNCGFSSLAIGGGRNKAKRCFNHRSFRLSECMDYSELSVLLSRGFEGSALTLFAEVHGFQLCQMQLGTARLFQIHQGFIT